MNKHVYLASLGQHLSGMPVDQVADIVRDYEQHFVDAMANGRSEQATASALGDPRKLALEFKAMRHLDAFQNKNSIANFGRMVFALLCVAGFNFFLLPFVLIAPTMLLALYLLSAGCSVGGAVITASGLVGVNDIAFEHDGKRTALIVNPVGLEPTHDGFGLHISPYEVAYVNDSSPDGRREASENSLSRRAFKVLVGILYIGAGIALLRLSRILARYLGVGARRYLKTNSNIFFGARKERS